MTKILKQVLQTPDSNSKTDPSDITNESKHTQEEVSIENFNQTSKNVRMTERATIEAMRRLGYTDNDLSYRTIHEFKRPGCDDSVTKLLYNKYKDKRQKIINEITEMREKVLDEIEKNRVQKQKNLYDETGSLKDKHSKYLRQENSPLVRIEIASIKKEKQNLQNLRTQNERDLKKIVISQFREYFQHQQYANAVQKTIEKTEQISQLKSQIIQAARAKALQPQIESPKANLQSNLKPKNTPRSPLEDVDRHIENVMKIRSEEAKKREEMRKKNEIHLKIAHEKSIEYQEKIREEKLKRINASEIRYQKWKDNQEQVNQQRIEKFKNRQQYELNVFQNGIKIEEEAKNKKLQKINDIDLRSQTQSELYKSSVKSRLDNVRTKINERSQKCQQELDKQRLKREEYRKKLDDRDLALEAKLKKQTLDTTLKYLSRKIDREEKIENAKRMTIRKAYMHETMNRKRSEDTRVASQLQIEKQRIMSQIASTDFNYRNRRDEILAEFKKMANPNDPSSKKKIAKLLNISVDEIDDLISFAKSSLGNFSSPKSAMQSSRCGSSIQPIRQRQNMNNSVGSNDFDDDDDDDNQNV